ncbi:uncharacterized protein [Diadema setosum]|uniref:uncharacterized protein n=1 Tax=Diadema setosum TaxID=31175 RepID=UPI003B3AFEBF
MAESSFSPLDAIEDYQENTGEYETPALLKNLSLDESDVEGGYHDLKSNFTDGDKSRSSKLISTPDDSGINAIENPTDEVKNTARTPKRVDNIIEDEASLFPRDSSEPQSSNQDKNRNESNINIEDWPRNLKRAHSAIAVRNEKKSKEVDIQIAWLIVQVVDLMKDMKEVRRENASLRAEIARMRQRMNANEEN